MKKNIVLIRENQYKKLQKHLVETQNYDKIKNLVISELSNNYEPVVTPVQKGSEYTNEKRIKKKIDGTELDAVNLLKFLKVKFSSLNDEFIQQIIKDWYNDTFNDDLSLSRNVPLD